MSAASEHEVFFRRLAQVKNKEPEFRRRHPKDRREPDPSLVKHRERMQRLFS
jgi:hypothetical protein